VRPRSDCESSSFCSHSERQGTFVSVQQFCNLSNWNLVTEPQNVGFCHKLFTVNLLFSAITSRIAYYHTCLSSGSNWILKSVLAAINNSLFKPATLKFRIKAMYFRMMKYGQNDPGHEADMGVKDTSSYPSVFWLIGSFPSGFLTNYSFLCCTTVSSCVSGDLL